jgi:hypothetical protein
MLTQWVDTNIQWVDSNDYQWGISETAGYTYSSIFVDDTYVYNSFDKTLQIYVLENQQQLTSIDYDFNITSLYANTGYLFFGTTNSGIYYLDKNILSNFSNSESVYNSTSVYKQYPDITSNSIQHVHGNNDCISFCTAAGLDFFKLEPNGYNSRTTCSGIQHSFLLSERELYYTVSGTEGWSIYKVDPITNWSTISSSAFILSFENMLAPINDISTLKVSNDNQGNIYIFLCTDYGVCVCNIAENTFFYII